MQKYAHGLFCRNLFIRPVIAFNEIVTALVASVPLFFSDNTVFYR
jgi:hypothetical protein